MSVTRPAVSEFAQRKMNKEGGKNNKFSVNKPASWAGARRAAACNNSALECRGQSPRSAAELEAGSAESQAEPGPTASPT